MASRSKLPSPILIALGLTPGCDGCDNPIVSPCLEYVPTNTESGDDAAGQGSEPSQPNPTGSSTDGSEGASPKEVRVGPCLKIAPPQPADEPDAVPVGPCLKIAPPDPPVGPCLEYMPSDPPPTDPAEPDTPTDGGATGQRAPVGGTATQVARAQTGRRVLERGVLPDDVARILEERLRG